MAVDCKPQEAEGRKDCQNRRGWQDGEIIARDRHVIAAIGKGKVLLLMNTRDKVPRHDSGCLARISRIGLVAEKSSRSFDYATPYSVAALKITGGDGLDIGGCIDSAGKVFRPR